MVNKLARWWMILPCLMTAWPLGAQEASQDLLFDDLPVVLTASRLHQRTESASAPVTVITREMIRASGARELPDLFRLVPGMVVGWGTNDRATVSYHGLSGLYTRRMQVLVDGRSVYQPYLGGIPWADLAIDVEDIDRIEVVRGPNAPSYGTNAFLGSINIIRRHPVANQGSFSLTRLGSNGILEEMVRHGGRRGSLVWSGAARYGRDHGQDGFLDEKELTHLVLDLEYRPAPSDTLTFHGGVSGGNRDRGVLALAQESAVEDVLHHFQHLRWDHHLTTQRGVTLQAYHATYATDRDFGFQFNRLPGQPVTDYPLEARSTRMDLELEVRDAPSDQLQWVVGGGYRQDFVDAPRAFNTDDALDATYQRLFANLQVTPVERLTLHLGATLEDHSMSGTYFLPRLSANYALTPDHHLRVGVSRATRTPTIFESFSDWHVVAEPPATATNVPLDNILFQSTGSLIPERITAWDLGLVSRLWGDRLVGEGRLFYEEITDLISLTPVVDRRDYNGRYFTYTNGVRARNRGVEGTLTWRYQPGHLVRLAYSYSDLDADSDNSYQDYLNSTPFHSGSILATFPVVEEIKGSLFYHYVGRMAFLRDIEASFGGEEIRPINRLDLRLERPVAVAGSKGNVALVGQSVLGPYPAYQYDGRFQTRVWAELALQF